MLQIHQPPAPAPRENVVFSLTAKFAPATSQASILAAAKASESVPKAALFAALRDTVKPMREDIRYQKTYRMADSYGGGESPTLLVAPELTDLPMFRDPKLSERPMTVNNTFIKALANDYPALRKHIRPELEDDKPFEISIKDFAAAARGQERDAMELHLGNPAQLQSVLRTLGNAIARRARETGLLDTNNPINLQAGSTSAAYRFPDSGKKPPTGYTEMYQKIDGSTHLTKYRIDQNDIKESLRKKQALKYRPYDGTEPLLIHREFDESQNVLRESILLNTDSVAQ